LTEGGRFLTPNETPNAWLNAAGASFEDGLLTKAMKPRRIAIDTVIAGQPVEDDEAA
jgi:hypothetical protein